MLSQLLFGLLILFLPSNLAYHFYPSTALVQGVLVDYLIPKLYLTDIFILGIIVISFQFSVSKKLITDNWLLITFFSITLIRGLLTPYPLAAFWFWLKLVEMSLFVWWLRHHLKLYAISYMLYAALPLAVFWQSVLAIAQWFKQGSIMGYWFLGEPVFSLATPGIAKISLWGNLKVLPYGTTPHPNVLAGFIAVSLVIIWLNSKSNLSKYITSVVGTFALFLTQSLSAWIALIIAMFSSNKSRVLAFLFILFIILNTKYLILDTESLSRRLQLNLAAIKIWADHPLFGVGLNQFTASLSSLQPIDPTLRFFQPVHNIYLLLLSETGLIGFVILCIVFWKTFFKNYSLIANRYSLPIIMLMLIGLVDHYPLTLQTGQLLLAISLGLILSSPK